MSAATSPVLPASSGDRSAPLAGSVTTGRAWKAPIAFAIFTLLAILLFFVFGRTGAAIINFTASDAGAIQIAPLTIDGTTAGIVVTIILLLATGYAVWLAHSRRRIPLWLVTVYAVVAVAGFLIWAATGTQSAHQLYITSLLVGSLGLSAPLIYGALGGVLSERVGVVNVAIEGQLLGGAFTGAFAASLTHNPFVGLVAAVVAGVLVSMVLGAFAVKYAVNQVIVGIVLNVLVLGLTTFLYQTVLVNATATLNTPPQLKVIDIPLLSKIPVVGPLLFSQTIIVYIMYVVLAGVFVGLFRTRWGLRLRAVGEHPQAADTVGINVARTRFWNVAIAGGIAGLGGAFYTIGSGLAFSQDMTNGAGYIALAAVIFGKWDPLRATLAALLFGFASDLQNVLGVLGSPVPNDFLLMLPYVVTILAVAGAVGRVRGPAASGRPYVKS